MAETLTLTTPITPTVPTISTYMVWSLCLGRGDGVIRMIVEDNTGRRTTCLWADRKEAPTEATDLLRALNKANLTTKSLERRCLERAIQDGKLGVGTVTGTPD